ncbi:hypothetical protein IAU59_005497 [Kwoniella sp. CBS 9459]
MTSLAFTAKSTGAEVAQAFSEYIKGKVVLVTGGTLGGLGAEFAAAIVKHAPKLVVVTARSEEKINETFTSIRNVTPEAPLRSLILDFNSLRAVRNAAEEVNQFAETIDVIVHNAGISNCPINRTEDGLSSVIAGNHAGPFLLTKLLLPKMLSDNRTPRIVIVGSGAHRFVKGFRWEDRLYTKEDEYQTSAAYAESKILSQLFAPALVRKSSGRVKAYSCSPGRVATQLFRYISREQQLSMGFINEDGTPKTEGFRTVQEGITSYLISAFDPALLDTPGVHISSSCKVAPEDVADFAKGPELEDRMWSLSEEWIGEKFDLSAAQ